MPDDQVTIDPEFQPPASGEGQGRWLQLARIAALATSAFMLGWLFRSPTPSEPDATDAATSTTTLTRETTSTRVSGMAGLSVPLGEAVPGFSDTIIMAVFGDARGEAAVDLVRWRSLQRDPETIVSFRDGDDEHGWFAGLDVAGTWYAIHDSYGVLSVRPVTAATDDDIWMGPTREAIGLRVRDLAWHDTKPSRLAWLSCPRTPGGPGTLFTLDVTAHSAEPVPAAAVQDTCDEFAETWISSWGDWGFALGRSAVQVNGDGQEDDRTSWTILLDPGGAELAQREAGPGGADLVSAGPAGTIWTEHLGAEASSFLLALDGQQRTPVPGLIDGEWVDDAWWSPDDSLIALARTGTLADHPSMRIVDAATGKITAEIDEPGSAVGQACWSSDGRFFLYGRDRPGEGPSGAELVVYDTAAAAVAAELPLPEGHDFAEIRTFDPATAAEQLTPVDWGIATDEASWGPGVYTVHMIADARYLMPDQVEDVSGRLIWDEMVVDLCNIQIRIVGSGFLHIGDIFQTTEGCGSNPEAMQDAFVDFGLPGTACLSVRSGGLDHEYCAPLK